MRMVGTVALDVARGPGATAVALACDLSAAAVEATERLRDVARTVVRGVVAVLRDRGPVVAALVTSFRAMPIPWFVAVGSPRAGGMSHAADPTAPRGRGLQMVDALTSAWGVTLHADGKTVWAVVG